MHNHTARIVAAADLHGDLDEIPRDLIVRNVRPRGYVAFEMACYSMTGGGKSMNFKTRYSLTDKGAAALNAAQELTQRQRLQRCFDVVRELARTADEYYLDFDAAFARLHERNPDTALLVHGLIKEPGGLDLQALERKGVLERVPGAARAYQIGRAHV